MKYFEAALTMMGNQFTSRQYSITLKNLGYIGNTKSGVIAYELKKLGVLPIKPKSKIYNKMENINKYNIKDLPKLNIKDLPLFTMSDFSDKQLMDEMIKRGLHRNFSDEELIDRLKERGYTGTLNPPSKSIQL
jgi:reverse gyrase